MKLRDMSREMKLLLFAMIIANIASNMYMPLLPLYLEELGADVQQVGFFFTLMTIFALTSRILGGWISDHLGRVQTIAAGGVLGFIAILAYTLAQSWQGAMLGALFGNIGSSMVGPSFQAYTAEQAPDDQTSSTFGLVNGLFLICQIVGPILGGLLVTSSGYRLMMWIATGIFAVAALIRWQMARGREWRVDSLDTGALVRDVRGLVVLLFSGGLLFWLFIVDGFFDAGMQGVLPFLPKFSTEIVGVNEAVYTGLLAWMSVIGIGSMIVGGLFADRFGEHVSISLAGVMMAGAWVITLRWPEPIGLALGFSVFGIAAGFIMPAMSSLLSKAVPKDQLGMTFGVFHTALGVLAIPAPMIGGVLYNQVAPSAPFLVAMALGVLIVPFAFIKLRVPKAESTDVETTTDTPIASLPATEIGD